MHTFFQKRQGAAHFPQRPVNLVLRQFELAAAERISSLQTGHHMNVKLDRFQKKADTLRESGLYLRICKADRIRYKCQGRGLQP